MLILDIEQYSASERVGSNLSGSDRFGYGCFDSRGCLKSIECFEERWGGDGFGESDGEGDGDGHGYGAGFGDGSAIEYL